jgi:hypothetical protein
MTVLICTAVLLLCATSSPWLQAIKLALEAANNADAATTLFCDDSLRNIAGGKAVGLRTVLVGNVQQFARSIAFNANSLLPCMATLFRPIISHARQVGRDKVSDSADYRVASLHELPQAVPELFVQRPSAMGARLEVAVENGVSPAAADAARRNGMLRLVSGASLDEADLTIQEAMEVSQLGQTCFICLICQPGRTSPHTGHET